MLDNFFPEPAQALAAEVVALEEQSRSVRVRELRLEKELGRALESHGHMQAQLRTLARDRGDLIARLNTLQARGPVQCRTSAR